MAGKAKFVAVFFNGVFEALLEEIVSAGEKNPGQILYLQPASGSVMVSLRDFDPSVKRPLKIYISTSEDLNTVSYEGNIVGWKNKRELSEKEKLALKSDLENHQRSEGRSSFEGDDDSVNLVLVQDIKQLQQSFEVSKLIKASNGVGCQPRTRPGGPAYISRVES